MWSMSSESIHNCSPNFDLQTSGIQENCALWFWMDNPESLKHNFIFMGIIVFWLECFSWFQFKVPLRRFASNMNRILFSDEMLASLHSLISRCLFSTFWKILMLIDAIFCVYDIQQWYDDINNFTSEITTLNESIFFLSHVYLFFDSILSNSQNIITFLVSMILCKICI
jgi:small-conductance mechanosensitive channel